MPSSFESMYEETRPLRLIEDAPRPSAGVGAVLAAVLLIAFPLLVVALL